MRDRSLRNMRTNKSKVTQSNRFRSLKAWRIRLSIAAAFFLFGVAMATWYAGNVSPTRAYNGNVSRQVVISQAYGAGGAAGATYTNDFVELLNTSQASIDISGWSVQFRNSSFPSAFNIVNLCSSITPNTCVMLPGHYYLVQLASAGANGVALPAADASDTSVSLSQNAGEVAVVNSRTSLGTASCAAIQSTTGAPIAIDFLGYSSGLCSEGTIAPNTGGLTNLSYKRKSSAPVDTDNNLNDFPTPYTTPLARNSSSPAVAPTAASGVVSGRMTDSNGMPIAGAVVNLSGTQNRKFITDANGNYRFDEVETTGFYTVRPSRIDYAFSPAEKSFSQIGNQTEAAFTGSLVTAAASPLDTPEYFVRQHYVDFLGREPDESGFNFWSDQILSCGADAGCIERRTINVSAAYFLSTEFQQTGGLVDGLYRASYGRAPRYAEFMPDTGVVARDVIVGRANWAQQLEANKEAFINAWVQRADFRAAYDGLANNDYVDALIGHTGVNFTTSEREALANGLNTGASSRAEVLRNIVEDERFVAAKRNETFVMMEYFGYLRRDPDEGGYAFWLNKLNEFNGNFEQAEMVKAFIVSGEYRERFPR